MALMNKYPSNQTTNRTQVLSSSLHRLCTQGRHSPLHIRQGLQLMLTFWHGREPEQKFYQGRYPQGPSPGLACWTTHNHTPWACFYTQVPGGRAQLVPVEELQTSVTTLRGLCSIHYRRVCSCVWTEHGGLLASGNISTLLSHFLAQGVLMSPWTRDVVMSRRHEAPMQQGTDTGPPVSRIRQLLPPLHTGEN